MQFRQTGSAIAVILLLAACGGSTGGAAAASPQGSPTSSPKEYKAQAAIDAWTSGGLLTTDVAPCPAPDPNSPIPRTWAEDVCFTIPSIAPHGGQVMSFGTIKNENAIVAYFALFPALAPYVYAHANVVVQLNSALTAAEAAKFDAALAAALGPAPAGVLS
jgi:hypothetical protein